MSLLGKLFGGKKKEQGEDPQTAIQRLRETEEMLNKKSDFLEKKIDEELKSAKTHGTKNKRAALQVRIALFLSCLICFLNKEYNWEEIVSKYFY